MYLCQKPKFCYMESFKCTIESIIFHSEDQGFSILSTSVEGSKALRTILINMPEVNVGITLFVEGEWVTNSRYGKQFKVEKWDEILPTTINGIEKYLCSGLIKGLGPVTAREMVRLFGESAIDIIESHSEDILRVPRMSRSRAEMIWASYDRQKGIREVMTFLKQYGITTGLGVKIYKEYGDDAIRILQENPYKLVYDIDGIGFQTADIIAKRLGFPEDHPLRLSSAAVYVLGVHCDDGDTYISMNGLVGKTVGLLNVSSDLVTNAIENLIQEGDLIEENANIFLPQLYHAEKNIAETLFYKAKRYMPYSIEENIVNIEKLEMTTNIEYDEIQSDAIRKAVCSNVMVITGGPGTGKTTITHGIVTALHQMGMGILLAAPTGKAADRMSEATGMEAKTIHRLLGARPGGTYSFNEENKLRGDVLIVDEVSMVNVYLMNSLLKAVPDNMRVILVGDVDQLPCIGPGNVLKDLIDSQVIPVIRLTKIYRQAQNSRIITNAHAINRGEQPIYSNDKDSDFFFVKEADETNISNTIVDLVCNRLPKAYNFTPSQIQVLTPMKKNEAGTFKLNKVLQEAINPVGDSIQHGDTTFRVGDKVIQTKNNYEKNIFNGDTGFISSVNTADKSLTVDYGDANVFYERADLDELLLAYALTIHKSQGSEYPIIVMPVTNQHYFMLSKNLLYTGITRAKQICVLVGSKDALAYGIRNIRITKRNTMLKERLINLDEGISYEN